MGQRFEKKQGSGYWTTKYHQLGTLEACIRINGWNLILLKEWKAQPRIILWGGHERCGVPLPGGTLRG